MNCVACGRPVTGPTYETLNGPWHQSCYEIASPESRQRAAAKADLSPELRAAIAACPGGSWRDVMVALLAAERQRRGESVKCMYCGLPVVGYPYEVAPWHPVCRKAVEQEDRKPQFEGGPTPVANLVSAAIEARLYLAAMPEEYQSSGYDEDAGFRIFVALDNALTAFGYPIRPTPDRSRKIGTHPCG